MSGEIAGITEMEENDPLEVLVRHRPLIVRILQPDRTLMFDYLRSKGILDEEDCDLISAEKTPQLKVGKFLDTLATRGPEAYQHFVEALQLESPFLYEKLTGEKPTERPSPIMKDMEKRCSVDLVRLFDEQSLRKQLTDAYDNLCQMSCKYDTAVKEKKTIHEELEKLTVDLRRNEDIIDKLEKENSDVQARAEEEKKTSLKYVEGIIERLSNLQYEYNQKQSFIIALQMKLLTTNEEINGLKDQVKELQTSKDELLSQLADLKGSYEFERTESIKVRKELQSQKGEMKMVDDLKRAYREAVFKVQVLTKERDDTEEELAELKHMTEILKARYDIINQELGETKQSHEIITSEKLSLRDLLEDTERKCRQMKSDTANWKSRCEHLQTDVERYKQQRDTAIEDRNRAIQGKRLALEEREEERRRCHELSALLDDLRSREEKHVADFDVINNRLSETQEQLTKKDERVQELEDEIQQWRRTKLLCQESSAEESVFEADPELNFNKRDTRPASMESSQSSDSGSVDSEKRHKGDVRGLLNSLKKRLEKQEHHSCPAVDFGVPSPTTQRELDYSVIQDLYVTGSQSSMPATPCSKSLPRYFHTTPARDESKSGASRFFKGIQKGRKNKRVKERSSSGQGETLERPPFLKSASCPKLSNNVIIQASQFPLSLETSQESCPLAGKELDDPSVTAESGSQLPACHQLGECGTALLNPAAGLSHADSDSAGDTCPTEGQGEPAEWQPERERPSSGEQVQMRPHRDRARAMTKSQSLELLSYTHPQ